MSNKLQVQMVNNGLGYRIEVSIIRDGIFNATRDTISLSIKDAEELGMGLLNMCQEARSEHN